MSLGPRWTVTLLLFVLAGCGPDRSRTIVIATPWAASERLGIESAFQEWSVAVGQSLQLRWLILGAGDDFASLTDRVDPPDLILGGPERTIRLLVQASRIEPLASGGPHWRVARRSTLGVVSQKPDESKFVKTPVVKPAAFDDFRNDPIALEWAESVLRARGFAEGYAELVFNAEVDRAPGRSSLAALAALQRADVTTAITLVPSDETLQKKQWQVAEAKADWDESIALIKGSAAMEPARRFLARLAEQGLIGPPQTEPLERSANGETLLADLLGSTLVDAQVDLHHARDALDRAGRGGRAERWMLEAPPWPPASVSRLLKAKDGFALVGTLAAQIAPDPATRAWLLQSWLKPSHPIDRKILDELGAAVDGGLVGEPRFRAWLRSEWTAWARQRYRRVARLANAGGGSL